ncbi:MAG: amidoligase family protein [bacterium]
MEELNKQKIIKIVKKIVGSDSNINKENYNQSMRDFLFDYIQEDMLVSFLKLKNPEIEDCYDTEKITARVGEFVTIDKAPKDYLKRGVRCYEMFDNKFYDVPINNLIWEEAVMDIAELFLTEQEIEEVLYPEKIIEREFNDIKLTSGFNFAYEVEGGFNEGGFERDLNKMGYIKCGDNSVEVDARYGRMEILVDGYFKNRETLEPTYKLMGYLREKNFVFNKTCGIHIHTSPPNDESKWGLKDILKMSRFYSKIEDYIYDFLPNERKRRRYSRKIKDANKGFYESVSSLPPSMIENANRESESSLRSLLGSMWYNDYDFNERTRSKYDDSRYIGFNIHSFFYRGTLEFRMFDGDYNYLPRFIDFTDKLINFIISKNTYELDESAENINNLKDLLQVIEVSEETKKCLIERGRSFGNDIEGQIESSVIGSAPTFTGELSRITQREQSAFNDPFEDLTESLIGLRRSA